MAEQVLGSLGIVVIAAEPDVAVPVHVDLQRIPRGHHHPDPDVQLAIHDQHGILNVLLDHPVLLVKAGHAVNTLCVWVVLQMTYVAT